MGKLINYIIIKKRLIRILSASFLIIFISSIITAPAVQALSQNDIKSIMTETPFYEDCAIVDGDGGETGGSLSGRNNAEKIWCYLRNKGLSKQSVAGIMGNLQAESHFDPGLWQYSCGANKGAGDCGFGIAQWSYGRKVKLWQKAGATQWETDGKVSDLQFQLDFLWNELTKDPYYRSVWQVIKGTPTVREALEKWLEIFEAPARCNDGTYGCQIAIRLPFANEQIVKFGNKTCGTATTDPVTGTDNPESQTVIVIDPGHTGSNDPSRTHDYLDPASGILDTIGGGNNENSDVYKVATKLKQLLESDKYSVVMTKESANDSPNSRARVEIANKAEADLALSIHYDSAHSFGNWGQVYAQEQGLYRFKGIDGLGPEKETFNNKELANKSIEYSDKFVTARKAVEGGPITRTTNNTFTQRAKDSPGYIAGGNIPLVQLWSDVPWVYNEAGAPSGGMTTTQINKYAQGLYDGVKKSIGPNEHNGAAKNSTNECVVEDTSSGQGIAAIIDIAKAEQKLKLSEYDYAVKYYGSNVAWCAAFASWVYKKAGYPLTKGGEPWMHGTVTV